MTLEEEEEEEVEGMRQIVAKVEAIVACVFCVVEKTGQLEAMI